jgi:putative SWIM zinc finger domain protein
LSEFWIKKKEVCIVKKLEESRILAMAPNASAISNAKKLCDKGAFLKLWRSVDDTLYMGECKGSGKSNYTVSVDFIDEENPVTRCTCPSRQFPCKHGLALLFEILKGKKFEECENTRRYFGEKRKKGKIED